MEFTEQELARIKGQLQDRIVKFKLELERRNITDSEIKALAREVQNEARARK